jgi:hypothetical protein
MTSMRYREIAAHGRDAHKRDQDTDRRVARIAIARRRLPALPTAAVAKDARSRRQLPALQTGAVPKDARFTTTSPTAPRTHRLLKRVRALGRMWARD